MSELNGDDVQHFVSQPFSQDREQQGVLPQRAEASCPLCPVNTALQAAELHRAKHAAGLAAAHRSWPTASPVHAPPSWLSIRQSKDSWKTQGHASLKCDQLESILYSLGLQTA